MSKQNRRSGKSFSTLGQRMLSFGRGIMRTYANETPVQADTSSEPVRQQGQWRSMTNKNLIWRQEQPTPAPLPPAPMNDADFDYGESDYANYDDIGQPIQRQPQQRPQQPVQRQPQPQPPAQPSKPIPSYIKSSDGTPVKVSRKQFPNELQRRLESIAAAHEEVAKEREQKRDKKVESIQRKVDSGEVAPYRRRGSIEVDYVQTESLLPADERGKPQKPIQTQREESSAADSVETSTDSDISNDENDESQWFDEIPDDDVNLDNLAGFESSDDDFQELPDDLPRFDASSLSQEDPPNDMGEFEGGYDSISSQSANPNTELNRDFDNYSESEYSDVADSSFDTQPIPESSVQRTSQDFLTLPEFDDGESDETVPLVPNYELPASQSTPSNDAPSIQRSETGEFESDISQVTDSPSVDNPPVQRQSIQRDSLDDFSFDDDLNDSDANFNQPSNIDSPVQRQSIQRDSLDDFSFDEGLNESDEGFNQPSDIDSPVQRQSIQRDSLDDISFDDDIDESDTDINQPSNIDSPVQQQSIQRDSLDDFSFDEGLDDSDAEFNQPPNIDSPVQRQSIQRDSLDDFSFDEGLDDSDTDFNPPSDIDSPVQRQSSIQRDSLDDFSFDEGLDDNGAELNQQADIDSPVQRQSIQRDPLDDFSFDDDLNDSDEGFNQQADIDSPVQRQSIQRDSLDDFSFDDDLGDSDAGFELPNTEQVSTDTLNTQASKVQRETSDNMPIQRRDYEHPDLGDGGDYDDFGNETWAEQNNYSSDSTLDHTTTQRDTFDDFDNDSFDSISSNVDNTSIEREPFDDFDDDFVANFTSSEDNSTNDNPPVQRDMMQRSEFDEPVFDNFEENVGESDYSDTESYDRPSASNSSPIQRQSSESFGQSEMDMRSFDDFGDLESVNVQPTNDSAPIQRQESDPIRPSEMDMRSFDDFGDLESIDFQPSSQDAPVQRSESDSAYTESANDIPIQRQESDPTRLSEMDMRSFDDFGDLDSVDFQPSSQDTPVQRWGDAEESDDYTQDYDEYGDATWAEQNNYSPATDSETTSHSSIQRDIDDNPSSLPYIDQDFDHLEDTDGITAMNILDDYLTERHNPADSPSSNNQGAPVQRSYQDETYDYLPDGFDPTPTIYDFNQSPDNLVAPPTNDAPIQRSTDKDTASHEQPIDLFQALSQAGAINTQSSSKTPAASIQRDYDTDADDGDFDDYSDYGDATWAEVNNYTPMPDHAPTNAAPMQREPQADFGDNDQPMDLFQALSQAGMIKTSASDTTQSQTPVQRAPQQSDENSTGLDSETIDLYNAMMQAGMIQDSSKSSDSASTNSQPVQRSSQDYNSSQSMMDMLSRATQVSESTSVNSSNSGNSNPVNTEVNGIAQHMLQRQPAPVSASDMGRSPETERQNTDKEIEGDDKEYLSQIARDVFRILKRRLREEKERRG